MRVLCFVIPFLLSLYLSGWYQAQPTDRVIKSLLLSITTILLVCEGSRVLIYRSHLLFRKKQLARWRLWVVIPAGVIYVGAVMALNMLLHHYVTYGRWELPSNLVSNIYVNSKQLSISLSGIALLKGALYFAFLLLIFETSYYFARLRHTEKENDRLEKEKLRAELFYLKEIVNPHFLFNSLNSLSALIHENPQQAERFLDELTKVYRYLLRNNESELTPLATEIRFIQSYIHLLRTRYGNSIQFELNIDTKKENYLLPPLTLQLLVENAVKHNRLMKEMPLRIQIYNRSGNELVISNSILKKDTPVDSTKVGLQNINAKYRLLNQPGLRIEKNDETFSVIIQLIEQFSTAGK